MVNPIFQQDEELLLNPFGSRYLASDTGAYTDVNSNEFVVQEDTIISVLTGGDASISENSIDYKASMNLSGVTLKKGALIVAPVGEAFKSITIDSGAIMAYNCVVGGTKPSGSVPLLLDDYPDAVAAYSLRKLRTDYEGDAIEVRRSVGTPSNQNIGFNSDGELDTVALLAFVGSGDGFVSTWYDQSGEAGNDAVQGSASAQPQIVSSGSVINENGKISVKFDGTTDYIRNELSVGPTVTAFAVSRIVSEPDYNFIYDSFGTGARLRLGLWISQKYFADNGDGLTADSTTPPNGLQNLFFAKHTNSDVSISVNQDTLQTVASTGFSQNSQYFVIGARNDGGEHFLDGTIQEIILYPSDQSANRTDIETNINDYYTIY